MDAIDALQLAVDAHTVKWSLLAGATKLKLKVTCCAVYCVT
jgi:hypothetical protein